MIRLKSQSDCTHTPRLLPWRSEPHLVPPGPVSMSANPFQPLLSPVSVFCLYSRTVSWVGAGCFLQSLEQGWTQQSSLCLPGQSCSGLPACPQVSPSRAFQVGGREGSSTVRARPTEAQKAEALEPELPPPAASPGRLLTC